MGSHTVVRHTTDRHFVERVCFSQVDREGGVFAVPSVPFEVGLFVATSQAVCQTVALFVAVRYGTGCSLVPVERESECFPFLAHRS